MHPEPERAVSEGKGGFLDVVHLIAHLANNDINARGILGDDIDVISVVSVEGEEGMVVLSEFFVVAGGVLCIGFIDNYH